MEDVSSPIVLSLAFRAIDSFAVEHYLFHLSHGVVFALPFLPFLQ